MRCCSRMPMCRSRAGAHTSQWERMLRDHDFHERLPAKACCCVPSGMPIISQGAACRRLVQQRRLVMTWETPAFCEIRLGFEVTAYVYVR
ncbi:pyrroloquinoline quinone precursor peptide PqqA [Noviherbaspirillum sp.]|uniref:pyrroloquinoline quinone precursor peptide PqqA n=1 Tax=Noviherbaspirillum sp. TaxID=1926288 RepID=UPI0039C9F814